MCGPLLLLQLTFLLLLHWTNFWGYYKRSYIFYLTAWMRFRLPFTLEKDLLYLSLGSEKERESKKFLFKSQYVFIRLSTYLGGIFGICQCYDFLSDIECQYLFRYRVKKLVTVIFYATYHFKKLETKIYIMKFISRHIVRIFIITGPIY